MKKVDLKIDKQKKIGEVNPYIFGHFIEFMFDCIDPGMYAQMLLSRGFEFEDANKDGISDPWYPIGHNDSYTYFLDNECAMAKSYAQAITIFNHFDGFRGVAQGSLRVEQGKSYSGYIWAKGYHSQKFKIYMTQHQRVLFESHEFTAEAGWIKYEFSFESSASGDDIVFEVRLFSEGTLWLDQASLRPIIRPANVWAPVMDKIKEIKPTTIRFPGGCYADCYHFEDGLGDVDLRPATENFHWGGFEQNNFGTDEFISFCRYVGTEPMICVNFGTGTAEEAANWVEYCNGDITTTYGALRAKNGYLEPYRVTYWDIGNENFGDWEIGHQSAEGYARKYLAFYEAMKAKDESIKFIACGGDGNSVDQNWNRQILEIIQDKMDILSLHMYAPMIENKRYDNHDLYYAVVGGGPQKCDEVVKETVKTIKTLCSSAPNIKIGVTEYNASYHNKSLREQTLEAAIFNAGRLNMFLRNADEITLCNASDLVNGWPGGLIQSQKGLAFGTPTFYAIGMYTNALLKEVVSCEYTSETFCTKEIGNIPAFKNIAYFDVVCCLDENNEVVILAVNRHLSDEIELSISDLDEKAEVVVTSLWSGKVSDCNSFRRESIVPTVTTFTGRCIKILPHSVNVMKIR